MFRQRLKGGHRVGAPASVTQPQHVQQNPAQQMVGWGGQQQQYSNPVQAPGQPPQPGHMSQPPQQQPGEGSAWGWGTENSDGAWNWGDSGNDAWSWNGGKQTAANHQQQLSQHQQPSQHYVQHHGYPQQLQHTSQQQQFPKSSQNVVYNNQHEATSTSSVYQQNPTNAQQFLNGNNASGRGADDWGSDNWGNDWESNESKNNNNNTKPANYAKQEHQQKQYYQENQIHHQQYQEYQQHQQYPEFQHQQVMQQQHSNAYQQHQQQSHYDHQYQQQQQHQEQHQLQKQEFGQQQLQHNEHENQQYYHHHQEDEQKEYLSKEVHHVHQNTEQQHMHHQQQQEQLQHIFHQQQQEQSLHHQPQQEQYQQQQNQEEQHLQNQQDKEHKEHQEQHVHQQHLEHLHHQQQEQHIHNQQQEQHLHQEQQEQHLHQQQQEQHLHQQHQEQQLQQQQQEQHLHQQQQEQQLHQQQQEQHLHQQQQEQHLHQQQQEQHLHQQQQEQHLHQQQQEHHLHQQQQEQHLHQQQQEQHLHQQQQEQHLHQQQQEQHLHQQQEQHLHQQQQEQHQNHQQQQHLHQQHQEQQLYKQQEQYLHQQQEQHPEHPAEEDWGWDNDDWQTNENPELHQDMLQQQPPHYHSEIYNNEMQVPTSEKNADTAHGSQSGTDFPQQLGSGDAAGDGWPECDIDKSQPDNTNQWQPPEPQMYGGQLSDTCPEDVRPPSHHSYQEQENQQQVQQQSTDGWKSEEPQVSQGAADAGVVASQNSADTSNFCTLLKADSTVAADPNVIHVKQNSWGWESNESTTASSEVQPQPVVSKNTHIDNEPINHHNAPYIEMRVEKPPQSDVSGSAVVTESTPTNQNSASAPVTNWDDGFGDGWEAETHTTKDVPTEQSRNAEEPQANKFDLEDNILHPEPLDISHQKSSHQPVENTLSTENNEVVASHSEKRESAVQNEVSSDQHGINNFDLQAHNQYFYGNMQQVPVTSSAGWDDGLEQNFRVTFPTADDRQDAPGAYDKFSTSEAVASLSEAVDGMSIKEDIQKVRDELTSLHLHEEKEHEHEPIEPNAEHQTCATSYNDETAQKPVNQTHGHGFHYHQQQDAMKEELAKQHHEDSQSTQEHHPLESLHSQAFHQAHTVQDMHPGYPQDYTHNNFDQYHEGAQRDSETFYHQESQVHELQSDQGYDSHQQQQPGPTGCAPSYPDSSIASDPMLMRIPDGASSVSDMPPVMPGDGDNIQHPSGETPTAPLWTNAESFDRPPSALSAQSTHSANSSAFEAAPPTTYPQRPPSSHNSNERPMSNQSAHSVHSISSNHSNRPTQAMATSQGAPLEENLEKPLPDVSSSLSNLPEQSIDATVVTSDVAMKSPDPPVDQGMDPTAPPKGNVMGPPPVSGPFGAMPNLRARKGSPFQPPNMKRGIGASVTQPQGMPVSQPPSVDPVSVLPTAVPGADPLVDKSEAPKTTETSGIPLWSNTENISTNVKLTVAAPAVPEPVPSQQPVVPSNSIPLVVPGLVKEETAETTESPAPHSNFEQPSWVTPEPPAAHNAHFQPPNVKPKVQTLGNMPANPSSPAVLDLSRPSRSGAEPRGDGSQGKNETPNFSRMVPGESSKDASAAAAPSYQAPVVVPSMPSERVVTGNDNPQPVLPVRIKQEPSEVRSPPDGPDTSGPLNQGASVVPPVRSETIGSEEPRNFTSNNSGSRPDLTSDHRNERSGRWERDHSRERDSRSSDRYRDRSHERNRDYYRDDSPHSRRSYDRDYDRKYEDDRRWRRRDSDDEEDDRRYYESRDRRDRAYRDELDRYSDRPIKEEKDRSHRESRDSREKRRGYRDRSKDYYHSYDDDPYYGRSDRSQPVSRSSSINNLDNDGDRSAHRSRHDYYDRHDRKDSRSRDSDPRDRDGLYSRDPRERDSSYYRDSRDVRDSRRDPRYYGHRVPYPSTPPHGRPMMQPPQLTGDNRDSVTQHRSAFPPPHEGLRGEGSLGNGEARNGHSSTSGNGHGIGPAGGHLGTAGEENLQRPIPSQRPYVPHTDRMRKDRGPYPNSRREPPQPSRDRWTYYGDPRIRPDQSFLRDPRDLRGDPRDYRERRDPRDSRRDDRRDPRDDRRDLRDDRRDPRRDPRDERRDPRGDPREERRDPRGDPREERRDPKVDPREERRDPRDSRRDPRDSRRDPQDERRYPREERRYYRDERLEGRSDRPVDVRGDSRSYREERSDPKERKEPREERDNEGEGAPAEDGLEVVDGRCPEGDSGMGLKIEAEARGEGKCQEDREGGRARPESEGVREREYERERDRRRYRETGRDPEREPLRREPVGEETGYESDHSRMSRTTGMTAYSTSSRSFHWRPRADSVASQASVFSHASTRPPPVPGRTPRGYEDPYASRDLYEQYQYYYQYYRDNPYYKEYFRQWMKQYGQAYASESFLDERNSIHSGRSSINDELKKSISSPRAAYDPYGYYYGHQSQPPHNSSQFIQDFHGRSTGVYEPSTIYSEGSFSQLKSYASGELSGVPSVTDETASEAPQRMTPVQFGRPHISASFTHGGQLLMVLPKDPRDGEKAVVQLRDVQKLLSLDPVIKEAIQQMKNYPGPLTLADTHKEVVVKYCEQQVADANNNPSLTDRESVVLIWEYLALLVKQNGKLLGSDIASLLLKGREVNSSTQHITPNTTPDEAPNTPASDSSPQDEGIDMHPQSTPSVAARDESLLLKKFTEYLCLGRKREAVDYAMREGLWGHALALSYKMDNNTHTRVLAAFSSSIPRTDVLLTLFQQLSGKRPEITKSYNAQQWGDWRQHLAMMVSNPSGHTQRDRASIITLGDTLASKGQLHAAHFCYLAAEAEWGTFSSKSSKLVLIGSSHHQSFQAFATNEAIQCSEVFEFARSLDSSNPTLETFLSYKLVYAMRLAEYGFSADSLRYCEVISQHVSKTSLTYPADFLSQVYDLASRLKYHDLHYQMCEGELLEMPDPEWLSNLQQLVEAAKHREQMTNAEINQDSVDPSFSQSIPHGDYYQQTHSERSQQMNSERNTYHQENSADSYHQGAYQGQVPTTDTLDGQNSHSADHPSISQPEGLDMPSPQSEVPQPAEGASQSQETAAPQIPMMQPQPDQSYGAYDTSYWSGYQQTDPNMMPFTPSEPGKEMSSLPPSSDVNGEHLSAGVTSFSQPNSLSGYPGYQQPTYQQWDQQAHGTPTRSPEPNEPQPSPSPQVPHEEEPQWSDMSGKKGDKNKERVESKMEGQGRTAEQTPKIENKAKRVSFKPQAEQEEDHQKVEDQKTSSARLTCSGVEARPRASATQSRVSMAPRHRKLEQNGLSVHPVQHFPGRVTNTEVMAALPANHPDRIVPPSRLPHAFSSPMLPMSRKMRVPSNPLVFGGSYPIDDPISPRQLGSGNALPKAVYPTPHTYQVDTICCQAPNLCDEHAKLGRDTEIARAEARMQVAQCNVNDEEDEDGDNDDDDDDSEEEPTTLSNSPTLLAPPQSISAPVSEYILDSYQSHSSYTDDCQKCTPTYSAVITYPVDRNVEDGLIPIIADDDDDDDYDYQDEEYDEFGGDLYEYEDEEVDVPEPDYETGNQLRHRHLNSAMHDASISSVTSASPLPATPYHPTPLQPTPLSDAQPSLQASLSSFPNEGVQANAVPLLGCPSAEPSGPASQTVLTTPPLFHPPPHSTQQMSSPPPLLGPNNHVTQSASSTTDATSEQKSESKTSSKDGDKDKSQEKNSSWSISSIFGWKKSKQAILPDDKNPTIVWDEAKKRWVNQDGEEEVAAPPPPPPKSPMSSAGGGGNSAPPPMKMRGMKKSRYVNTEKDKSQPNPTAVNPMIPPMPPSGSMNPTAPVMTPQFMVPDPSSAPEATSMQPQDEPQQQPQQQQQQQQQPAPPLPPEVTQMRRSRYISESSIELEDDWPPTNTEGMLSDGDENAGAVPMMSAPSMQPQFFNPAQFTPAPSHPARRPGPGRRAYPVKR